MPDHRLAEIARAYGDLPVGKPKWCETEPLAGWQLAMLVERRRIGDRSRVILPLTWVTFNAKLKRMEPPDRQTGVGLRHPAVLAWLRLARVFQKITMRSERLFRTHGLNMAQFDVLAQIGAHGEITQQGLADALLVTKGNISQLLARMERENLIVRRQEGRVNMIALTSRGEALRRLVVPLQEAQIVTLLAPLTPAEQAELLRLLRKLDQHLDG